MNYHIAFAPDLDVRSEDFAAAWNETPQCRALAEARVVVLSPKGFPLDPQMIQQGLILLAGAAGGLALDALKDAVKDKLTEYFKQKLSPKPEFTVDFVRQPGGGLLIVTQEDV